ncbi:MAG: hypothetical protein Q9207_004993 [Kuettlingeria erythrocarpa]
MRVSNLVAVTSWLNGITFAIPWIEPLPTPQGLLADAGVSPRPTDAPGIKGIPRELRRRQQDVLFPPPDNWCGFVEGDYDVPLTCPSSLTCVNSNYYVGCCSNTRACTKIYTTCYDYGTICDSDCEANDRIRKCTDSVSPFCGTYSFPIGTYLYNCEETTNSGLPSSVKQLSDFYETAISSSFSLTNAAVTTRPSVTYPSYTSRYTPSSSYSYTSSGGGGLSTQAIRGIAIGVSIGVCALFILLAIFIVRRRRANRMKRASQPNLPPAYTPSAPMQLQQQASQVYQPVPQQDQSYPPTQAGFFAPSASGKSGVAVTSQPSLSPGQNPNQQQRYSSTMSASHPSPNSTRQSHGSIAGRDSFMPTSPTITEIDGSNRPLPEADSIQRPLSTHTGMVSPLAAGSSAGSPPPATGHFMQHHGNPAQEQPPGQGQVHNGYAAPRQGTHEVAATQPFLGPHEMPNERQ